VGDVRDGLSLYLRYAAVSLRAQLQYRGSVIMQALGTLLVTAIEFVGVWALFARFGNIRGFRLPEVALLYGMVEITFAVADMVARGFDAFSSMVVSGDFDRLLVRPRSTVLQLAGQELALKRVGRLLQGLAVLLWAAAALDVPWSGAKVLLLLAAMAGGVCLFCGIFVLQATLAFWTIEPLEIMAAFSHGGVETAHYPLPIYRRWFRTFFTFVIPLACANYLPSLAIMGKADPLGTPLLLQWLAPLAGGLFLALALQLWKLGVRRYVSAGG
jgi:ABC-2 type transport system permease protein